MAVNEYRWNGAQQPQTGAVTRTVTGGRIAYVNKGVQRTRKAARRLQAETRNALTPPERRRKAARESGYVRHSIRERYETARTSGN